MKNLTATYRGVITACIMIIASVLFFYGMHLPENGNNQYVILAIYLAGIIWSLAAYAMSAPATAGFKDYFSEGFKTFIVVVLFMTVFTFVFYKLNPQIFETTMKENNLLLQKEGNHTTAEIAENAEKLRNIFMPMTLATIIVMYLLIGAAATLIGSLLLRRKKN